MPLRLFLLALLMAAACLLAPATAGAAWSPPQVMEGRGYQPKVDLAPDGTAAVGYNRPASSFGADGAAVVVREPDGRYTKPFALGDWRYQVGGVAAGNDGLAFMAYTFNDEIRVVTRKPGEDFGDPEVLAIHTPFFPLVVTDGPGNATMLWTGGDRSVQASLRSPGGTFGAPITLDEHGVAPQAAVDETGRTTVVWLDEQGGTYGHHQLMMAVRERGGDLGPAEPVSSVAGLDVDSFRLVSGPGGELAMEVGERRDMDQRGGWWLLRAPPGGAFGSPVDLSAGDPGRRREFYGRPRLAVGLDGRTIDFGDRLEDDVRPGPTLKGLQIRRFGVDGTEAQRLLYPEERYVARASMGAFDSHGVASVLHSGIPGPGMWETIVRPDREPCPPVRLTDGDMIFGAVDMNAAGQGFAVWQEWSDAGIMKSTSWTPSDECPPLPPDPAPPAPAPAPPAPKPPVPVAPPRAAPLALPRSASADARLRSARVVVRCGEGTACTGTLALRGARGAWTKGAGFSVPSRQARGVRVSLSATLRRALRRHRSVRVTAGTRATGSAAPAQRRLTLRRAKR